MTEAAEATVNAMAPGMRDEFDPFGPKVRTFPEKWLRIPLPLTRQNDIYSILELEQSKMKAKPF